MKVKLPYRMTNKQRKAMCDEIEKQIDTSRMADGNEYDAAILWAMHLCFGFGKKRLRRFYDYFFTIYLERERTKNKRKEIELLKDIGVDVEEWNRES